MQFIHLYAAIQALIALYVATITLSGFGIKVHNPFSHHPTPPVETPTSAEHTATSNGPVFISGDGSGDVFAFSTLHHGVIDPAGVCPATYSRLYTHHTSHSLPVKHSPHLHTPRLQAEVAPQATGTGVNPAASGNPWLFVATGVMSFIVLTIITYAFDSDVSSKSSRQRIISRAAPHAPLRSPAPQNQRLEIDQNLAKPRPWLFDTSSPTRISDALKPYAIPSPLTAVPVASGSSSPALHIITRTSRQPERFTRSRGSELQPDGWPHCSDSSMRDMALQKRLASNAIVCAWIQACWGTDVDPAVRPLPHTGNTSRPQIERPSRINAAEAKDRIKASSSTLRL